MGGQYQVMGVVSDSAAGKGEVYPFPVGTTSSSESVDNAAVGENRTVGNDKGKRNEDFD